MAFLIDTILGEALAFVKAEADSASQVKTLVDDMSNAEITRLQAQNALLLRLLETEKVNTEKAKDELLQRISGLLGDYLATRDSGLREVFGIIAKGNGEAEEVVSKLVESHDRVMNDATARGADLSASFQRRRTECKRTHDGALKAS